ncbi:hypothetical protein CHLRE_01g041256v5 [Chlamydomonas reinhardtii]|uniref:Uncharacterized protein n=1 Tax=Chlamydomonas reinhardtii TaxID=3055 RepID=A0A2K3E7F0_CHLRE|nr:uncharacterized protein CHLRE_01g041256v5 [Chlamydomonas reinhardtii]PNW88711.1 hypothetical protein CHLRE_01g041256v5 [Chlamydomonas reinhardtii]
MPSTSSSLYLRALLMGAESVRAYGAGSGGRPGLLGAGDGGGAGWAGTGMHASGQDAERQQRDQQQQGAGADAPPAPRRLVDSAAKLLPELSDDDGVVWKLTYGDRVMTYVDAAGVVDRIRSWAEAALRAAVNRRRANAPAPLLVSGLIKTGKSYNLEHVVPAVVAEALCKQQQQAGQQQQQQTDQAEDGGGEAPLLAGMIVLRLRGDKLVRKGGATAMLKSLLNLLLEWARKEHVPMRAGALAAAEAALARPDLGLPSMPGEAIFTFLKAVEVPVLVLCDEVQSLFSPTIGDKLDAVGAGYMRDAFVKELLVYGPHTVLWCLTGSDMAQTWVNIGNMPPNGYALITHVCATHLPSTYSAAHINCVWQQLQQDSGPDVPLDRRLLELCPRSIALLTVLVSAWVDDGRPSDVDAFVQEFMRSKLMDELCREWKPCLEAMALSQRLAILDLSLPAVGARIITELHSGLRHYLAPHLEKRADGRYFLRDSYQRQIVRFLFTKEGELCENVRKALRDSWSELEFSATLTQLDGGWNLFYLGEAADYLLGASASRRQWQSKEPPAEMKEFEAKLQAIADDVAVKLLAAGAAAGGDQQQQPGGGAALGPQELWERQLWFQEVLNSKWNSIDRETYTKNKQTRSTHLAMLVLYLRLSRNALGHTKPWDREADSRLDVGVVEALPGVLGQSLFAFNEAMVGALRLLSRPTVQAAAAAFAAELSGGGGEGSINEGSGEDDSSSGGDLNSDARGSSGTDGAGSTSSGDGCGRSSNVAGAGRSSAEARRQGGA